MLPQDEYTKIVRRPYPPLLASSLFEGILNEENYVGFINDPFLITQAIQSNYNIYYIRTEQEKVGWATLKDWSSTKRVKEVGDFLVGKERTLLKAANSNDIKAFLRVYAEYAVAILPVQQVEWPIEKVITTALGKKVGHKRAKNLLDKLNIPLKDNYYKQEERNLMKTDDLKSHVKKYIWLNSRYGQYCPYKIEEAQKRKEQLNKDSYIQQRKDEKSEIKQAIDEAKGILGSGESYLVDLMQFIVYYRTRRTDILNRSSFEAYELLNDAAQDLGLTYEQFLHCMVDEVLSDKLPSKNIIDERIKGYDIYVEDGELVCVYGEESKQVRKMFSKDLSDVKEIKGVVASPGKVKGQVRLIFNENNLKDFKKGEILVATMTTPNMVLAMRRAAAIITDEGGITCHAAIISRELKKPCLINTKIATDILKDGDQVKVDANCGIIKKL